MLGITPFGMLHTLISLVSLFAGLYALARWKEIRWSRPSGKLFVPFTAASCITGLFIFRHGGFNEAHVLSIITLVVLAAAWFGERGAAVGSLRERAAVLAWTLVLFFHFIPGFNETLVRVPVGNPVISGPDDPFLQKLVGATFAVFLVIMALQWLRLRRSGTSATLRVPGGVR